MTAEKESPAAPSGARQGIVDHCGHREPTRPFRVGRFSVTTFTDGYLVHRPRVDRCLCASCRRDTKAAAFGWFEKPGSGAPYSLPDVFDVCGPCSEFLRLLELSARLLFGRAT
jgi:hypothetical protein